MSIFKTIYAGDSATFDDLCAQAVIDGYGPLFAPTITQNKEKLFVYSQQWVSPPGAVPPSFVEVEFSALENISKYNVVTSDGLVATSNVVTNVNNIIGIALDDYLIGETGRAQQVGQIDNPAWAFTTGEPVFLTFDVPETTPPVAGFVQIIGAALSPTRMEIDLKQAVVL
jgi:hypothetical protein